MSRVQTPEQGDATLRPAASPVNRFSSPVQPLQEEGPTKAAQLSSALSDLVPELLKFSANADQRQSQDAVLAARDMRAKNAITFKDAVTSGKISPDQNPWFIKTWKEMDGNVAADRYNEDLTLAMSSGPLANSTSQEDSNKLLDNFRSNWVKANLQDQDKDYVAGFGTRAAGYDLNVRAHQAAVVGRNIVAAAGDTFDHNAVGILQDSRQRGVAGPEVAVALKNASDKYLMAGGNAKDLNEKILKAVAADAEENYDSSHAHAILDSLSTGPGGTLGGTAAAKTEMLQVESNITNKLHQADAWAYEKKKQDDQAVIANSSMIVGDGMLDLKLKGEPATLEQFKTQIQAVYKVGGWEAGQNFEKAIIASNKENFVEAQQTVDDLTVQVLSGHQWDQAMFDRMNRELAANTINRTTYRNLLTIMNEGVRQDKQDAKEPSFFKNDAYKIQGDDMDRLLGKDDVIFDATREINRGQADAQYWIQIYRWDKEHPKATHDDQIEFATKTADRLKQQFRGPELKNLAGSIQSNIQKTPGISSGAVKQVGAPTVEQDFANGKDFDNAIAEATANPKGNSRIAQKAAEYGLSVPDYLKAQLPFYPDEPAKK